MSYRKKEYYHSDMYNLSHYLTDDVGPYGAQKWIAWIKNPIYADTESNYCFLEKEESHVLVGTIPSLIADDDPYRDSFKIPTDQLIYILEQWKQVWEHKPDEVIITQENDIYQVIQKSNDMSQA